MFDPTEVPAGPIRAGDELTLSQGFVRDDLPGEADRPDRARLGAERVPDLVLGGGPKPAPERRGHLRLLESVVTANEPEHERPVQLHDRHCLRGGGRVDAEEVGKGLDRAHARRLDFRGGAQLLRKLRLARHPVRDLEVGGVVAVLARHERVLSGPRRSEEVDRGAPAHHPRLRPHGVVLEPATLEDAVVGALLRSEAPLEALLVTVEGVGVLHDELAHADESGAWAGLVPDLRLEVVEDLRQLAVGGDLARVVGDRLLVRHGQHERPAHSILGLPELGNRIAPARLPQLGRRDDRHEHLLAADGVHLLPDDLHRLLVHAPPERQERPETRAHLADEAAADEQAVARRLGIARVFPERRDEELGRLRHQLGRCAASAIIRAAGLASLSRFGRTMPSSIHVSISRKSSSTSSSDSTFRRTRPCA